MNTIDNRGNGNCCQSGWVLAAQLHFNIQMRAGRSLKIKPAHFSCARRETFQRPCFNPHYADTSSLCVCALTHIHIIRVARINQAPIHVGTLNKTVSGERMKNHFGTGPSLFILLSRNAGNLRPAATAFRGF